MKGNIKNKLVLGQTQREHWICFTLVGGCSIPSTILMFLFVTLPPVRFKLWVLLRQSMVELHSTKVYTNNRDIKWDVGCWKWCNQCEESNVKGASNRGIKWDLQVVFFPFEDSPTITRSTNIGNNDKNVFTKFQLIIFHHLIFYLLSLFFPYLIEAQLLQYSPLFCNRSASRPISLDSCGFLREIIYFQHLFKTVLIVFTFANINDAC